MYFKVVSQSSRLHLALPFMFWHFLGTTKELNYHKITTTTKKTRIELVNQRVSI